MNSRDQTLLENFHNSRDAILNGDPISDYLDEIELHEVACLLADELVALGG